MLYGTTPTNGTRCILHSLCCFQVIKNKNWRFISAMSVVSTHCVPHLNCVIIPKEDKFDVKVASKKLYALALIASFFSSYKQRLNEWRKWMNVYLNWTIPKRSVFFLLFFFVCSSSVCFVNVLLNWVGRVKSFIFCRLMILNWFVSEHGHHLAAPFEICILCCGSWIQCMVSVSLDNCCWFYVIFEHICAEQSK